MPAIFLYESQLLPCGSDMFGSLRADPLLPGQRGLRDGGGAHAGLRE